ncbi:hypothetical protein BDR26DRAFT_896624 [Obelidium mucronatum]|nr:hypothetical protein BDR26DRAFT_896624 [Obelidium mucronatum]
MSFAVPSGTALSPACYLSTVALIQEESSCHRGAPDDLTKNTCWCDIIDVESLKAYCSPVENDKNEWISMYEHAVDFRASACAAANKTVPTGKPLLALPTDIPNPLVSVSVATATTRTTSLVTGSQVQTTTTTVSACHWRYCKKQ